MGFIAGFANAGSDAIDRRLGQIQQQEDTAYQLVAQRFLDNSRKRTEANAADEARIRSAHTLAEQAGMPDAWTHAYDMLVAGLTPLQVAAKLDESTFSPFDPNGPEAQQQAPTDATASESTQDAGQPVDLMQQGSRGPNQPASNAVDISTLNPIQNFINTGMGGIFNRANRTSSRMEQMSQQFRTNMGISQEEFDTTMNDTFQPQTVTHTGQLIAKTAVDDEGMIYQIESRNENGDLVVKFGRQDSNGNYVDASTGEEIPIEDGTVVRSEAEQDKLTELMKLNHSGVMEFVEEQSGVIAAVGQYMKLTEFFADPNNADILTGTSGVLAMVDGLAREADTIVTRLGASFGEDATYNNARDVEEAIISLMGADAQDMVGERALFTSLLAGAAYELARSQNGSGVLSNRDIEAAFKQIQGNTSNPIVFVNNLQNMARQQIAKLTETANGLKRTPEIARMAAMDEITRTLLGDVRLHMTENQVGWLDTDPANLVGRTDTTPDDQFVDTVEEEPTATSTFEVQMNDAGQPDAMPVNDDILQQMDIKDIVDEFVDTSSGSVQFVRILSDGVDMVVPEELLDNQEALDMYIAKYKERINSGGQ